MRPCGTHRQKGGDQNNQNDADEEHAARPLVVFVFRRNVGVAVSLAYRRSHGGDMTKRATAVECRQKAKECRDMAKHSTRQEHRIMLQHMADTWERIAIDMEGENGKDRTDPQV